MELTVAEPCFPIRVAHGHVQWLIDEGVDFVFVPNQVNEETDFEEYNSHACPWGQTLPFVVRTPRPSRPHREKFLAPRVRFREGREGLRARPRRHGPPLGARKAQLRAAPSTRR